jgi:hypothetical protein
MTRGGGEVPKKKSLKSFVTDEPETQPGEAREVKRSLDALNDSDE